MAIYKKNKIRGLVGKVVSRELFDKEILQSAPRPYENTIPSKISAFEGGISSTAGKIIRQLCLPLNCKADTMLHSRLTGTLKTSIFHGKTALPGTRDLHDADLSLIKGFQLNKFSVLNKIMAVRPIAELLPDGRLCILLDRFSSEDIKAPANYLKVILRFLCFAIDFRAEQYRYVACIDLPIPDSTVIDAQQIFIDCPLPNGTLLFLTCSLHWGNLTINGSQVANTKEYSPAEIIGVWKVNSELTTDEGFEFDSDNNRIEDENYHWEEMKGYKGNKLLVRAAEFLKKANKEDKTQQKKQKENRFPFKV